MKINSEPLLKTVMSEVLTRIFEKSTQNRWSSPDQQAKTFPKTQMKRILITLFIALGLSGCATPTKMAFQDETEKVSEKRNPIFLMTATLKNIYKTSFQPQLLVVHVEKPGAKEKADRLNFTMDEKAKNETDSSESGNNYLLRLELAPGEYEIRGLSSRASKFPIHGFFFTPIHSSIESKEPGVFYLGHVNATIRERNGNEFKAGASIPLIDQAVVGASGGTFDVEITDQWSTDEASFLSKFPALAAVTVKKAVLPPFDRAKAQQWWESN